MTGGKTRTAWAATSGKGLAGIPRILEPPARDGASSRPRRRSERGLMSEVGATRWARCSIAGLGAAAGAFALTAVAVFVYAFRLAFEVRGAPDQASIQAFARAVGPAWGPWLRVALALAFGAWIGRTTKSAVLEGVVVGLLAAIPGLWLAWPPDSRAVIFFVATTVAAVAGVVAARRRL